MPRKIEARQSDIHGNGVFAIAPIEKGERVVQYKGKRRTHEAGPCLTNPIRACRPAPSHRHPPHAGPAPNRR